MKLLDIVFASLAVLVVTAPWFANAGCNEQPTNAACPGTHAECIAQPNNGACVALGVNGCEVYADKPFGCAGGPGSECADSMATAHCTRNAGCHWTIMNGCQPNDDGVYTTHGIKEDFGNCGS